MSGSLQLVSVGPLTTTAGSQLINLLLPIINSVDYTAVASGLNSGNNTIAPASGTSYLLLVPPSTNTHAVYLRGITGDTGVPLHNTSPTILAIDPNVAPNIVLNAAASITGYQVYCL